MFIPAHISVHLNKKINVYMAKASKDNSNIKFIGEKRESKYVEQKKIVVINECKKIFHQRKETSKQPVMTSSFRENIFHGVFLYKMEKSPKISDYQKSRVHLPNDKLVL